MLLYRLLKSRDGRKRSEFPVGELALVDGSYQLDVPDRTTRQALEKLFAECFRIRVPAGNESVLAHAWEDLMPGTARHFDEAVRRLPRLGYLAEK